MARPCVWSEQRIASSCMGVCHVQGGSHHEIFQVGHHRSPTRMSVHGVIARLPRGYSDKYMPHITRDSLCRPEVVRDVLRGHGF